MPITPFHFGIGLLGKGLAPRQVSLSAFVVSQILIDCESAYFLLTRQWPVHRWCHTFFLAIPIGLVTGIAVYALGRLAASRARTNWLVADAGLIPALIGGGLGGLSHPLLDGIMHADILPFRPFTDANPLLRLIGLPALHLACVLCGMIGLVLARRRVGTGDRMRSD